MMKLLSSPKFIMLSLAFLGLVIVPITIIQIQNQQTTQQQAEEIVWLTDQSASTGCPEPGKGVIITVHFSNTEPDRSNTSMDVIAKDQQTGKSVDMGSIRGGTSKTAQIVTGRSTLNAGTVTFNLTWSDGHSGVDSRTASYPAAQCASSEQNTTEPNYIACPPGTQEITRVSGMLLENMEPRTKTYTLNLPEDSKISVVGYAKEGHPEDCPSGPSCHQGQMYEEFTAAVNGTVFGEYTDHGADLDAWINIGGPWETSSIIPKGTAEFKLAHKMRNPDKTEPESVDYKLTVCAAPKPTAAPTPTPKPTAVPTPKPSATPTPKPGEPTPTVCPTLGPVQNIKITCPNC